MKKIVIDIESHFYCNLIKDAIYNEAEYIRRPDFKIAKLFNIFNSSQSVYGWSGKINRNSFFIIVWSIISNQNIFNKNKTLIVLHRIIDHFPFVLLSIFFNVKPIVIFHGRCDRSKNKLIYYTKYFISFILFCLEKKRLITRYFIQEETKVSYFGNTGYVQRPTIINKKNYIINYQNSSKNLIVSNYPERSIISKKIFEKLICENSLFWAFGASNVYKMSSIKREELLEKYQKSFSYISLLRMPEVYYNLSLIDACDHYLPILCLNHKLMPLEFKKNVLVFDTYEELIFLIKDLKHDQEKWKKYSKLSNQLLVNFFPSSEFRNTWKEILKK